MLEVQLVCLPGLCLQIPGRRLRAAVVQGALRVRTGVLPDVSRDEGPRGEQELPADDVHVFGPPFHPVMTRGTEFIVEETAGEVHLFRDRVRGQVSTHVCHRVTEPVLSMDRVPESPVVGTCPYG